MREVIRTKDSEVEVRVSVAGNLFLTIDQKPGIAAGVGLDPIQAATLARKLGEAAELAADRRERLARAGS